MALRAHWSAQRLHFPTYVFQLVYVDTPNRLHATMGLYGARDFQMQATRVEVLQDAIVQNQNSGSAKHDQNVTTVFIQTN